MKWRQDDTDLLGGIGRKACILATTQRKKKSYLKAACRQGKQDRNETKGNHRTLQIKLSLWTTEAVGEKMISHIM